MRCLCNISSNFDYGFHTCSTQESFLTSITWQYQCWQTVLLSPKMPASTGLFLQYICLEYTLDYGKKSEQIIESLSCDQQLIFCGKQWLPEETTTATNTRGKSAAVIESVWGILMIAPCYPEITWANKPVGVSARRSCPGILIQNIVFWLQQLEFIVTSTIFSTKPIICLNKQTLADEERQK